MLLKSFGIIFPIHMAFLYFGPKTISNGTNWSPGRGPYCRNYRRTSDAKGAIGLVEIQLGI